MRRLPSLIILAALLFSAPAFAQAPGTISLTGNGEVAGAPDMAIINSGVVSHGKTAREALNQNTTAMNQIFAVLQQANVEQRDIQTSGFSIFPQYSQSNRRDANGYPMPSRVSGYQVSNTLTVRVRNLEDLGQILDNAVSVGSNQINSISFAVTDTAPLLKDARRAAMADALEKAALYTDAAGVKLGDIVSISEGPVSYQPKPEMVMMSRMSADAGPVPVAAGELSFSKQVSVVWQLVQDK